MSKQNRLNDFIKQNGKSCGGLTALLMEAQKMSDADNNSNNADDDVTTELKTVVKSKKTSKRKTNVIIGDKSSATKPIVKIKAAKKQINGIKDIVAFAKQHGYDFRRDNICTRRFYIKLTKSSNDEIAFYFKQSIKELHKIITSDIDNFFKNL